MKKISSGKFELFTTKADAIDKFMQMQGFCRNTMSDENTIVFYCTKKGRITITNDVGRHNRSEHLSATELYAEVTEQDGRTYADYYTSFSKSKVVAEVIAFIAAIILIAAAFLLKATHFDKSVFLIVPAIGLAFAVYTVYYFISISKQEKNSPKDSEILIKELEDRVNAVNLWDK